MHTVRPEVLTGLLVNAVLKCLTIISFNMSKSDICNFGLMPRKYLPQGNKDITLLVLTITIQKSKKGNLI